jgi:hypothetical protein
MIMKPNPNLEQTMREEQIREALNKYALSAPYLHSDFCSPRSPLAARKEYC